jgi:hypothetical protein
MRNLIMKQVRIALFALASMTLLGPAIAEVRTIWQAQEELAPPNQTFTRFGQAVAIDGGAIIVLATNDLGQSALLYRRSTTNGPWTYRRTLLTVAGPPVRASVRMKNGIAAVQFGELVTIFEYSGGDYVRGRSATSIRRPGGIAISGHSILVGGNDCDYDAVIYQKGADGNWALTGRMDDNQGQCRPEGFTVELNYDYALLGVPGTNQVAAWRRNGTAFDWVPAGNLEKPPGTAISDGKFALQNATAVAPGNFVFRRSGATWTPQPMLMPVDYANGSGSAFDVKYRDGVLLTIEAWTNRDARPYAYLETSPGRFEHAAILWSYGSPLDYDVSGRTVVTTSRSYLGDPYRVVQVFNLPTPLEAPSTIVDDFEGRDLSGFTFEGGQFALATRGTNDVLARTNVTGAGVALVNGSDSSGYQRIEAVIAPTYSGAGWAGLVARYVDADNYYYVAFRDDNTLGIYRRLNGVNTLLSDGPLYEPLSRVRFTVDRENLSVAFGRDGSASARDASLRQGRAGLATFQARADFDDVLVGATDLISLQQKAYVPGYSDYSRPFTELGGRWELVSDGQGGYAGLAQVDLNASALAFGGTPVENQEVIGVVRFDAFGTSRQGAWFGLLARYVDARNHYYLTVRSTNQLQIRKQVNGVITVLASVDFTAVPRQFHEYRLRVVGDQLHAYVDGALVAWARDGDIARGQYGIGTYRARAMWQTASAIQP